MNSLGQAQKLKLTKEMGLVTVIIGSGDGVFALLSTKIPNLPNRHALLAGGIIQISFFFLVGVALWRCTNLAKSQQQLLVFVAGIAADAVLQIALRGPQHLSLILVSHIFLALFALVLRSVSRR